MKRFNLQLMLAAALCCGVVFAVFGLSQNRVAKDLVVHEWGTFTSIQGSDGVPIYWQSRDVAPLPGFVYDWKRSGLPANWHRSFENYGKGVAPMMVQRMETPVVYFYSPREQTVDLKVEFPKGQMTEWYPRADEAGPTYSTNPVQRVTEHMLRWPAVHVLPMSTEKLPEDKVGSHYYAARETDSAALRIDAAGTNTTKEFEKFLFYRGVGNFKTPLKVSMETSNVVTIDNVGSDKLQDLFVLQVHDGMARFVHVKEVKAGQGTLVGLDLSSICKVTAEKAGRMVAVESQPVAVVSRRISEEMAAALVKLGLFDREATAMVKTWKDSWFEEDGIRVLYPLARKWTDETLPMSINPQPEKLVRVMVGRAEVISPSLENKLANAVIKIGEGDFGAKVEMKQELHRAGRFANPLLVRVFGEVRRAQKDSGKQPMDVWQTVDKAMAAGLTFDSEMKEGLPKAGEDEVHYTFKVANLSTNEIVIEKAQGSCGCTYAKMPSQPWHLRVGESGELPVTMTLKGKPPGEITKEVTLFTSDGQRKLMIKTVVPTPPAVKTAALAQ